MAVLHKLPKPRHYWVAYSGGIDSSVLLHALGQQRDQLQSELIAIHINHGLSPNAEHWVQHCQSFCETRKLRFEKAAIDTADNKGKSPEAWARELRYKAMADFMEKDDVLLTAHQQDDLAETILLQLLRGSGPEGLSGIPEIRPFGTGWIARPLLSFTRKELEGIAAREQLQWIEDESNSNVAFDRNFIRHCVMPVIAERWPSMSRTLSRSARHQAEMAMLMDEIASSDLDKIHNTELNTLKIKDINNLSDARKRNALRFWLKKTGLPVPGAGIIENIINEVINAKRDSTPCVGWEGAEVRRYRDLVYAMQNLKEQDSEVTYKWCLNRPLELNVGRLEARLTKGKGLKSSCIKDNIIDVRFRYGGESIRPAGRKYTHDLKKLFQEIGIPPWQRDRIPLLYLEGKFAAVPGLWIDHAFNAKKNDESWDISLKDNLITHYVNK